MVTLNLQKLTQKMEYSNYTIFGEIPFWIRDREEHKIVFDRTGGCCCFNHIISLPRKGNVEKPIFDYELQIFDALQDQNHKGIWIKKATGLGITELMLRYILWLCLKDNKLRNTQICIVTGPRIDLAIDLIRRMKKLLPEKMLAKTKETLLELNNVRIEAFPSFHLDSVRGLPNVSLMFLDEADFFSPREQEQVRDIAERYIGKSGAQVIMVSTPNSPNGLFQQIEEEYSEEQIIKLNLKGVKPCIYYKIILDYTVGLGKIYSEADIKVAMNSHSWLREFCLQYGYGTGTIFTNRAIELFKKIGLQYRSDYTKINERTMKSMAIDPGFGGQSGSAIVISELMENGIIRIIYARRRMSLDLGEIMKWTMELRQIFDPNKIYVDGFHMGFIRGLKKRVGERWKDEDIDRLKNRAEQFRQPIEKYMHIIPVVFGHHARDLLGHARDIIENEEALAVDPEEFRDLYLDIVSAKQEDGKLIKEGKDSKDLFDALMMNLQYYDATPKPSYIQYIEDDLDDFG